MKQQLSTALQAITLSTALFLGTESPQATEAAAPPASQVHRAKGLIEQLGDDEFDARESASIALRALVVDDATAESVVPHVRAALKSPDLEVRRRAGRLMAAYYDVSPTNFPCTPWLD